MDDEYKDVLLISKDFGENLLTAYMKDIKQVVVSRFADLAGDDVPPDFDKYSPDDFVIVARYKDGRSEVMAAGNQFTITL